MHSTLLLADWLVRARDAAAPYPQMQVTHLDWMPAVVPGQVELDLVRHGVIQDPFFRCGEAGARWVEETDWSYRTEFEWTPKTGGSRRVLRFDRLDTVATVSLNGEVIARHDNCFTPLEVDVTNLLATGINVLQVDLDSAVRVGRERRDEYFKSENLPNSTPLFDERAFVRKPGYMYGWDWGPRLVSCGIGTPELLEFEERIRNATVHQQRLAGGSYRVWIEADVEGVSAPGASFNGVVRAPGEALEFIVDSPKLWWPNGEGEAHLYDVRVFLASGHEVTKRVGLRDIQLVREVDDIGRSFEFVVNGRRIWSRGANWIPNDSFVVRDTAEGIHKQIDICRRLGMNMLRVWGGGYYESDAFYDACDELGILVWQDFPFACSFYPDGTVMRDSVSEEATYQIQRLRDRTSLALWCGNNEIRSLWRQCWAGPENQPPRFFGEPLYDEVLKNLTLQLDPTRPYIESSPLEPGEVKSSDDHYWDVWHGRGDWNFYQESFTRFSSEFGFASSCSRACWDTALAPEDYAPRSVAVRWHDKTHKPVDVFERMVYLHYPVAETLDDWIYVSQLNQRDALRCGIEHYRRSDFCRGALIWQFNDCWPVQSWAVQDYSRLLKPAGFELERVYAPVLLSWQTTDDEFILHAINDSQAIVAQSVEVLIVNTRDASAIDRAVKSIELSPDERQIVLRLPRTKYQPDQTALRAEIVGVSGSTTWTFASEPKDMKFGSVRIEATAEESITVRVTGFAGDLIVWDPDDAFNLFSLSNGQPGLQAVTCVDHEIKFGCLHRPSRLMARSLAGTHTVVMAEHLDVVSAAPR